MRRKKVSLLYRLRKGRRGQSMAIYAIITASMLIFGSVFAMKILPDMLDAFNNFAASMYFSINMPIP